MSHQRRVLRRAVSIPVPKNARTRLPVYKQHPRNEELPLTRGECEGGPRPCPLVSCRQNLFLDITDRGSIKLNFPDREPWDVPPDKSCVLDIADHGGVTLDEIGAAMNLSHERVRQLEERGLEQLGYSKVAAEVQDAPVPLNYNEWITANEVLDRLCITWPSLQRLFDDGRILRQRDPVTNRWRYRMSDVVEEKHKRKELQAMEAEKEQRGVKG